jgi:mRNA-degrading endonuclease RelE of RelBE toxin-antitoxin system
MAYKISITQVAENQLHSLSAREQRTLEAAILARLRDQPTTETKSVKRLRPNPLAEFEFRVGDLRILYNVEEAQQEVLLLIVGRKVGNSLIVGGIEFHEHRSDPPQPPPDRPTTGAQ